MENNRAAMRVSWTPHLLIHIIGQVLAVNIEETVQCSCASSPAGFDIYVNQFSKFISAPLYWI